MLHPSVNPLRLQLPFARYGRMQIRSFLQERAAELLRTTLADQVPWTLACRRDGVSQTYPRDDYAALAPDQRSELLRSLAEEARGRYGFAYESYMMVKAHAEGLDPGLILHRVLEYLNTDEFLFFARTLTGVEGIRMVSAQATRYRDGHFLRQHDDRDDDEGRVAAYVINLTPAWQADWGGLLHFVAPDGSVGETFFPWYNSLSVFKVPQPHFVSAVQAWAEQDRLAITGWFRT